MSISLFLQNSGFKVLSLAHLSQCEYSIILYLLNSAVSGLDQIITSDIEISETIKYDEEEVSQSIKNLVERNLIRVVSNEINYRATHPTVRMSFQFDMEKWQLNFEEEATSKDAVVYPFARHQKTHLEVLPSDHNDHEKQVKKNDQNKSPAASVEKIIQEFIKDRSFDDYEIEDNTKAAHILIETHPPEQVLMFLKHFQQRIPSLSLLASNWDHFQELFENETQWVDLVCAKKKHQELDQELKESAKVWLDKAEELNLSHGEIDILKLFIKHRHPRRQLFWAYKSKSRYMNLNDFFDENSYLMLAVTSQGIPIKKNKPTT